MKRKLTIIAALSSALAFSSCSSNSSLAPQNEAQRTAVNAGAAGAVLGAVIGNQSGKTLEGAALGAAVGAGGGYLYGQNKSAQ